MNGDLVMSLLSLTVSSGVTECIGVIPDEMVAQAKVWPRMV